MKSFIVICCVIAAAYGQEWQSNKNKPCPVFSPIENLNIAAFLGRWDICEQYATSPPGIEKCSSMSLELNGQNDLSILYSGSSASTGQKITITGEATYNGNSNITVQYNLPGSIIINKNYTPIKSDYANYIVFVSCKEEGSQNNFEIWYLARDCKTFSNYKNELSNVLNNIGYEIKMTPIDQSGC